MRINWQKLFSQNNIPFIDRGPNVKRGNLNIRCPFCGVSDPSYHMGVDTESNMWACWRNKNHRGKSPVRLLVKLLKISYEKARDIAGLDDSYVDPDGFDSITERLERLGKKSEVSKAVLSFPSSFKEFDNSVRVRRHVDYMINDRGFDSSDFFDLCDFYNLRAATDGLFKDRVILPYYMDGELVTWAGRSITRGLLRYRALSHEESLVIPEHTFFNYDCLLQGGEHLIVVEGPMDALKLDYYGKDFGVRSISISTNALKDRQKYILESFSSSFKSVIFMMDSTSQLSLLDSIRMRDELNIPNGTAVRVPYGKKDAGELSSSQVVSFCRSLK